MRQNKLSTLKIKSLRSVNSDWAHLWISVLLSALNPAQVWDKGSANMRHFQLQKYVRVCVCACVRDSKEEVCENLAQLSKPHEDGGSVAIWKRMQTDFWYVCVCLICACVCMCEKFLNLTGQPSSRQSYCTLNLHLWSVCVAYIVCEAVFEMILALVVSFPYLRLHPAPHLASEAADNLQLHNLKAVFYNWGELYEITYLKAEECND